jgi:phosphatidylglycerophosphatase A
MCAQPAIWIGNPYRPFCTEHCKLKETQSGIAIWIATCAGVGYFPLAPGTAGSVVAVAIVVALNLIPFTPPWPSVILAVLAGAGFGLGVWAGTIAETFFGRTDPGPVVIDEMVGQFIPFVWLQHPSWKELIAGFVLFRIFDIVKPFPARRAEHASGGWGIMLDDVVAGVYALGGVILLGLVLK